VYIMLSPIEERFWAKVNKIEGGCWEWTAAKSVGYGRFKVDGRLLLAHRFSYELQHGPIPEGLWVLHHCDNPCCVNPEHLFLGTRSDNMLDCVRKGRHVNNACTKLTKNDVLSIRRFYKKGCNKQEEIAVTYGVSKGCISDIIMQNTWKHL